MIRLPGGAAFTADWIVLNPGALHDPAAGSSPNGEGSHVEDGRWVVGVGRGC